MPLSTFSLAVAALCGGTVLYLLRRLYKARSDFYYSKVKKGMPMPPWNPIFGHLLVLDSAFRKHNLPPDIQMPDVFAGLSKEFGNESDSLFYMDLWPFSLPMLLVSSPNCALQICQKADFAVDRPDILLRSMYPIIGGRSVFGTNGFEWKEARSVLQSGLNSNNILNQLGHVVDEAEVLIEILKQKAHAGEVFQLDHLTVKFMMDISGNLTL
jgi:cytochrome P450